MHGSLDEKYFDSLVFTRSQYRSRLYANPAYLTALRALLATSPVLFLGYSLTDAYLNELRAELVEAFSQSGNTNAPLAWALLEDVSDDSKDYFLKHEGLEVISFNSCIDGRPPFSEFDRILGNINDQTNPIHLLRRAIGSKRILWFDPKPENNSIALKLLEAACKDIHDQLVQVTTLDDAIQQLAQDTQHFDLVISHWGHLGNGDSNGLRILQRISEWRSRMKGVPPVLIFAKHQFEKPELTAENRKMALRYGAAAYETQWNQLMSRIENLLS